MWEAIELRELRVFLTLAEELHFGRSGERLGLTPSRVSQSLRELEDKLGGRLLHRTSRTVSLTPLGERFLAEAEPAYAGLARVLERTRAANRRLEGILRVGLLFPTSGGPHMTEIIDTFSTEHPGCEVQLSEIPPTDALGPVQRGKIDVLAMRLPIERPDLVVGPILSRDRRVLAVARDHALAKQEGVSIEDVAAHKVLPISELPEEMIENLIPHHTPGGRPIERLRTKRPPRTPHELISLVARGRIVHPTVASLDEYVRHPEVVYVPIVDLPPSKAALVWRRPASDPRLREFIRVAREVLRTSKRRSSTS
jgi:DNA-binding transcriptional LysR family regulator